MALMGTRVTRLQLFPFEWTRDRLQGFHLSLLYGGSYLTYMISIGLNVPILRTLW